jgi:hypothetical protein
LVLRRGPFQTGFRGGGGLGQNSLQTRWPGRCSYLCGPFHTWLIYLIMVHACKVAVSCYFLASRMDLSAPVKHLAALLAIFILEFCFFPIAIGMPAVLLYWLEKRRSRLLDHCSALYAAANTAARHDLPAVLASLGEIERLEARLRSGERPAARTARWALAVAAGFSVALGVVIGAELIELTMSAAQNERLSDHLRKEFLSRQSLIYGCLTLLSSLSTCYVVSSIIRRPPQVDFSQQLRKTLAVQEGEFCEQAMLTKRGRPTIKKRPMTDTDRNGALLKL